MGVIDHAPQIFLRAFSGAGTIAPISWPSLQNFRKSTIEIYCVENKVCVVFVNCGTRAPILKGLGGIPQTISQELFQQRLIFNSRCNESYNYFGPRIWVLAFLQKFRATNMGSTIIWENWAFRYAQDDLSSKKQELGVQRIKITSYSGAIMRQTSEIWALSIMLSLPVFRMKCPRQICCYRNCPYHRPFI
jgi:hypothetical protein